jgi:hypothetical protein
MGRPSGHFKDSEPSGVIEEEKRMDERRILNLWGTWIVFIGLVLTVFHYFCTR